MADQVEMRSTPNGIAQILGYNVAVNSDYFTNSGLKVIPFGKDLEKNIIGEYKLNADWGNGIGEIYKCDQNLTLHYFI